MSSGHPFRWESSSRTDVGTERRHNEDSCIARPEIGLWAVADGMGGHAAGDLASGSIVESLAAIEPPHSLSAFVDEVEDRLLALNGRLREMATREEVQTIGSTVAALLAFGHHGVCLWAGDSRVYRYRDGELELLTQDHTLVEELVDKGVLSAEEAIAHPQSNLVTRAVGATDTLYLDAEIFELEAGDRFVLCSDGLDKEVNDPQIAAAIEGSAIESLSDALVELALQHRARDNVTVVAVKVCDDLDDTGGSGAARGGVERDDREAYGDDGDIAPEDGDDTVPAQER